LNDHAGLLLPALAYLLFNAETVTKMKRILCLLIVAGLLVSGTNAQVTENFDSRNGVALTQLKGYLQSHCWTLPDLDITRASSETNGWVVPGGVITPNQRTGIYTPVLDVADQINISFNWQFDLAFEKGTRRWVKVFLTDPNNIVVNRLDSFECPNVARSSYNYNRTFMHLQPGIYKIYVNYQGTGGTSRIAIDQLIVSAPLHYTE
jgi:hypothetical protein